MPNIEPLISIIVPVYNSEKYLSRCIESILAQSFKNLEIILIDDGSKDASSSICDSYAASDSRIKSNPPKKMAELPKRKNTGLDIAHGDYIAFAD